MIENQTTPMALHDRARFAETLERIRITLGIDFHEWCELLGTSWANYSLFRSGQRALAESAIVNVADHCGVSTHTILAGSVDVKKIAVRLTSGDWDLPERYKTAAYGRRRTSISSMDFVEQTVGWRTRVDLLQQLKINEAALVDPFAPISMTFISDLCEALHRRLFQDHDFFEMGAYSYVANRNSLIGRLFAEAESSAELYRFFIEECMQLFERNCRYQLVRLSSDQGILEIASDHHVAEELGLRHLGNRHVCQLKGGLLASMPLYLGLPRADVRKVACVHKGDAACRYEFDFASAQPDRGAVSPRDVSLS